MLKVYFYFIRSTDSKEEGAPLKEEEHFKQAEMPNETDGANDTLVFYLAKLYILVLVSSIFLTYVLHSIPFRSERAKRPESLIDLHMSDQPLDLSPQ